MVTKEDIGKLVYRIGCRSNNQKGKVYELVELEDSMATIRWINKNDVYVRMEHEKINNLKVYV